MGTRGELAVTEPHPAAFAAQKYLADLAGQGKMFLWSESFASCAIEGNRLAEVCSETLNRLLNSQPVSDRYILGLAFTIMQAELNDKKPKDHIESEA
jgi:hypothetical protein